MDIFFFIAVAAGLSVALTEAYGSGADDLNWEMRWRDLDPVYRNWLAALATKRSWIRILEDPKEIWLAEGAARRESRRRAPFDLAALGLLLVVAALVVAGALPTSACSLALTLYLLPRALAALIRNQQIRRRVAVRSDSEEAPPRQGTAPAWS